MIKTTNSAQKSNFSPTWIMLTPKARSAISWLFVPALVLSGLAMADPAPTNRPATRILEEVVVTANKREESIRDLAASVSVVGGEALELMGAQGQDDFLKLNPGVTLFDDGFTARQITVRGIAADVATNPTTGILMGDVAFNDAVSVWVTADPNPFDLSRIEVLKGPQGTLFGASGLNGAVRYIPQAPILNEWQGKGFVQTESVNEGGKGMVYGAAINVPIGEQIALRFVGHDRKGAGWIDENQRGETDVNKLEQDAWRVLGLWQPSDATSVSGLMIAQQTALADYPFADNAQGELSRSNTPVASPTASRYELKSLDVQHSFNQFDIFVGLSQVEKDYGGKFDLSRVAGDNPPENLSTHITDLSESFAQELRLSSGDGDWGNWTWVGGLFYRQIDQYLLTDVPVSGLTLPITTGDFGDLIPGIGGFVNEEGRINVARNVANFDVNEMALFGETTWTVWSKLELTLGLRAYRTTLDGVIDSSGPLTAADTAQSGNTKNTRVGKITEQGLNPKLTANYFFSDTLSVYASVARGFRFGGMNFIGSNATTEVPDTYKSDTLWSYETGLRSQWLEKTLVVDVTPFYSTWEDPQLYQNDNTGNTVNWRENVGGVRSYGVEFALQYLPPIDGLNLSFAAAWITAETTEAFTTNAGTEAEPGTPWPQTAEYQTATTLSYTRGLFGNWAGNASLVHAYLSEASSNLDNFATIFGYQTLDLQLGLFNPSMRGAPSLSLNLSNLTDERGVGGAAVSRSDLVDRTYIRPRTLTLRLGVDF